MKERQNTIQVAIADEKDGLNETVAKLQAIPGDGLVIDIKATNGAELISQLARRKPMPDICIVELRMDVKDGYETIKEINEKWPAIKPLVLTDVHVEEAMMQAAIYGANGYIDKHCTAGELFKAIAAINDGNFYGFLLLSATTLKSIKAGGQRHRAFTEKQMFFLRCCASEYQYKEIAVIMGVRLRAVHEYRDALFTKLGIHTRQGLAMFAASMGLQPPVWKK